MNFRALCLCLAAAFAAALAALPAWGQALDDIHAEHAPMREGLPPLAPALEARVHRLGKEIRCPMCQGLSVADSASSSARAQMDKIRELVQEGKSDADVRAFFVSRYGEWTLLQPSNRGFNRLLYAAPFALLALGLAVLFWRRSKTMATMPQGEEGGGLMPGAGGDATPDAAASTPDAAASTPDAADSTPDAAASTPDAAASTPDAGASPHLNTEAAVPTAPDNYAARVLRAVDAPPAPPLLADAQAMALYARYENVLGQLREHQEEKHLLSPAQADKEEARLVEEAVGCLRQLDAVAPAPPPPAPASRLGLGWVALGGLLVGVFVVFSVSYLFKQAEVLPPPAPHPAAHPGEEPELMAAFEYFHAHPEDLDGAAYLAKLLLHRGKWEDATLLVLTGSRADPLHVPFRIYRCFLEGVSTDNPSARRARAEELATLYATYDGAHEAAYWAAALYSVLEDKPKALEMLLAFKESAPLEELPPFLDELIAENQPAPPTPPPTP